MKRVTIYAVAQACGVSASTVSRAMARPEVVNPQVRERILRTAEQMGHHINRAARGLATGRTGTIALLVPDITNPFFPPLVRSIQQAADRKGWSVLLLDTVESAATETDLLARLPSEVDGVLLASPRSAGSVLRSRADSVPTVLVNRTVPRMSAVLCDNSAALAAAGEHLMSLGHRNIALATGSAASWAAGERAKAVRRWAEATDVRLIDLGAFPATFAGGRDAGTAMVGTGASAAFAFDDLTACGMIAGMADADLAVPADVSLVGCDDVLLARATTPALTTVSAPFDELGSAAIDLLAEVIDDPAQRRRQIKLPGALRTRASTEAVVR